MKERYKLIQNHDSYSIIDTENVLNVDLIENDLLTLQEVEDVLQTWHKDIADTCLYALNLKETIKENVIEETKSYESIKDTIKPDCMHCRVDGHCSCSRGSNSCKHLFWCNRHN
jgi:hypothetical protein